MQTNQICEDLISSWLLLNASVKNNRLVQAMTFREICVCHILYDKNEAGRNEKKEGVTATDIACQTGMLKSQTNKVLNDMEKRGMLERIRSGEDRRIVYLKLSKKGKDIYEKEHRRIVRILGEVTTQLGDDKLKQISQAMNAVAETLSAHKELAGKELSND